jgi:hypothetical protein
VSASDEADQLEAGIRIDDAVLKEDFGESVDRGQRCPKFMGKAGDELVFGTVKVLLGLETGFEGNAALAELTPHDESVRDQSASGTQERDGELRDAR